MIRSDHTTLLARKYHDKPLNISGDRESARGYVRGNIRSSLTLRASSYPVTMTSEVNIQHRAISVRFGVLSRADGSCFWSQGGSSVLVAVYGPHKPKRREHEYPDRAHIHFKILSDHTPQISKVTTSKTNPTVLKSLLQVRN
jgi:hypothetical protein